MHAQHLAGSHLGNNLDQAFGFAYGYSLAVGSKVKLAGLKSSLPGLGFLFGNTDHGNFRRGKDAAGYSAVIYNRIHAHGILGGNHAGSRGGMGQYALAGNVTDGVNTRDISFHTLIDDDAGTDKGYAGGI